jgi:hypothetical protein
MSLKFKIDNEAFEKLDDTLKSMYSEKDGDYVLDVDGVESEENIKGLKSALEKEREAKREYERKLKQTQDANAGIDKDKYEKLLAKEREAEEAAALKAGEYEKLKEQIVTQHKQEMDAMRAEVQRRDRKIEELTIDSAVTSEVSKAGGNVELLKPHVKGQLKLDSDTLEMVVLDSDGKTPKVDANGNPAKLDTLISEMRKSDTFASAFKATDQSGGGSEPNDGSNGSGSGTGGTPKLTTEGLKRSTMTDRQKIDFQNAHGLDALLDLPE